VHAASVLVLAEHVFVAVGDSCVALRLSDGAVAWANAVDLATCFGLHATRDGSGIVVHGELTISRWTPAGERLWEEHGRDVFTSLRVEDDGIHAVDFEGASYVFDDPDAPGGSRQRSRSR
jgi:hypothetical protein